MLMSSDCPFLRLTEHELQKKATAKVFRDKIAESKTYWLGYRKWKITLGAPLKDRNLRFQFQGFPKLDSNFLQECWKMSLNFSCNIQVILENGEFNVEKIKPFIKGCFLWCGDMKILPVGSLFIPRCKPNTIRPQLFYMVTDHVFTFLTTI